MGKYFDKDVSLQKSKNIRVAGYDKQNDYMVICFGKGVFRVGNPGTCYHYCRFAESIWESYKKQNNQDRFYEQNIKGKFDCRYDGGKYVPIY